VAGNEQATVSWTPGADDGGSKVVGYTVRSHGGVTRRCYTNTADPNSSHTSCTVSNLENGTPYAFTVIARNYNGDSPASEHSAPVTPRVGGI